MPDTSMHLGTRVCCLMSGIRALQQFASLTCRELTWAGEGAERRCMAQAGIIPIQASPCFSMCYGSGT